MSHDHFIEAQHAASIAVAAMALRDLLARSREHDPSVVSLRVEVTHSAGEALAEVNAELIDRTGQAVGGFGL